MISILFFLLMLVLTVLLFVIIFGLYVFKNYVGTNIKCGGDMVINGRRIPKRKDLDVQDVCVVDGRFKITYTDGSILVGDDDPAHDMFTKG